MFVKNMAARRFKNYHSFYPGDAVLRVHTPVSADGSKLLERRTRQCWASCISGADSPRTVVIFRQTSAEPVDSDRDE